MAAHARTRRMPVAMRRELELATAVARDAVFSLHTTRAEALVQLAAERVSALRMLQIYTRIHALPEPDADFLINRVLADIGRRAARTKPAGTPQGDDAAASAEADEPPSLLRHLRERLRGRVLHDLRSSVELQAGVTEVALLRLHVKHAIRFLEILQPRGDTIEGVLHIYQQALGVRPAMNDMLYYFVLERLAAEPPAAHVRDESAADAAADAAPAAAVRRGGVPDRYAEGRRRAHAH